MVHLLLIPSEILNWFGEKRFKEQIVAKRVTRSTTAKHDYQGSARCAGWRFAWQVSRLHEIHVRDFYFQLERQKKEREERERREAEEAAERQRREEEWVEYPPLKCTTPTSRQASVSRIPISP